MTTSTPALAPSRPKTSPWLASVYGGIFTAIIVAAFSLLLQTSLPILWIPALILIGAGPVLGYQLAAGKLGQDWKSIIGGILGTIIPIIGQLILWPLLVWLFNRSAYSLGRLWLGSILGLILGIAGFWIVGTLIGQDPAWFGFGGALAFALWGGTAAAFMTGKNDPVNPQ